MRTHSKSAKWSFGRGWNRGGTNQERRGRLARFESLESRNLLSITLPTISAQTLLAGAGLNLVLDGTSSEGNALTYSVSLANVNLTGGAALFADVAEGNPSLQLSIAAEDGALSGDLVFQLFEDLAPETVDKIMAMVESGYYDGLTFHRIIEDFMIQGGDPDGDGTGGPEARFDDEYSVLLQFTSPGLLAMANSGNDTNGSQFFITTDDTRWLDFNHTIFGILTEGDELLDQLDSVATDDDDAPLSSVTIVEASIVEDTQNGVLRLFASNGVTGTASVTVTATDSVTGETVSRTFAVTVSADTMNDPPFLDAIDPIVTTADTAITFNIPGIDIEGDAMKYGAVLITDTEYVTLAFDDATGAVTITPTGGACGVVVIQVGVSTSAGTTWDTQYVPVCITPYAPSSVSLVSDFDTGASNSDGLTNLNNGAGATLQFSVAGVTSGMTVNLYADGVLIGSTVAAGSTATVTTDGTAALADGTHTITATQALKDQAIEANNYSSIADLESPKTTTLSLTVASAEPVFDFTPASTAIVGAAYHCQVALLESSVAGLTYAYSLIGAPAGMSIGSSTGLIEWTPSASQTATTAVVVQATDSAGNTAQTTYSVTVLAENAAPVLVAAAPALDTIDENTAMVVAIADFINNGEGTTTVTDSDLNAEVGGIAIVGLAGDGVWAYSLDGATFTAVGSVSESSALLLPADASLRYTPSGAGGETAAIVYRAWDTTGGVEGAKVDLSAEGATGGETAFSDASDTASLVVTAVVENNCSISGYVYIDADNDGLRMVSTGQSHMALQGVAVTLFVKETDGSWTQVASTATSATGTYGFTGLAAGTYKIVETQPTRYLDGRDTLGTVGGVKTGTAGNDQHIVTLADGQSGVEYNFGERGLSSGYISLRSTLASSRKAPTTPANGGSTPIAENAGDTTAPAGYSVAFSRSTYDTDSASSVGFFLSNAEAFTMYRYVIMSDGDDADSVTKTGILTLENFIFTGIDVSDLADGTLTLSITLTDAAGNTGEPATATATLDR